MSINSNLDPLESAATFPYLGHTIAYNNINWVDLYQNLRKVQQRWGMVSKVLLNAGGKVQAHEMMYKSVAYMVLLYGSESLVVMDAMMKEF